MTANTSHSTSAASASRSPHTDEPASAPASVPSAHTDVRQDAASSAEQSTVQEALAAQQRHYEAEIAAIEDDLLGEIARLERDAAERERALIAERNEYRAQAEFAMSTKGWRASVAYWRARERGLPGALALGGQLGEYLLRVGYHLSVPYRLRRDLWYRRHTGQSYARAMQAASAAEAEALATVRPPDPADPSAPANIHRAVGPDALVFPSRAWDASAPRARLLAQTFAATGRRCRWLHPQLAAANEPAATERALAEGIAEVTLPGDGADVTARTSFRRAALRHALAALTDYCYANDLREVVCVVQHASWAPLVEALRRRYGCKVIYDLAGAETEAEAPDARFDALLADADLVYCASPAQRERLAALGLPDALDTPLADTLDGATLDATLRRLYGRAMIIIVTYRNLERTRLTLKSVLEKTRYPNYEVLLVDNGGQPAIRAYAQAMAERFPGVVRCIFNAENLGFAGGNNVGLRAAQASEYIVLLNDDVIVTAGWLGRLVSALDDPAAGMVGPVTNACANEARVAVDYTDLAGIDDFARRYSRAHDGERFEIDVLAMYCAALRQRTVAELGELDERFRFGMFEDDDYAERLRAAGYRLLCLEDVYVHHFGASSFSKLAEERYAALFAANRALFEQKWQTTWRAHKYREG